MNLYTGIQITVFIPIIICLIVSCITTGTAGQEQMPRQDISIAVDNLSSGDTLPVRYTCDGEGITPVLKWSGVSQSAKSLLIIMDDPDAPAGVFTHWILSNISPDAESLPEAFTEDDFPEIIPGLSSGQTDGYYPPCPPPGQEHRYIWKIYALDIHLPGANRDRDAVLKEISGHVLAEGEFDTRYKRS